MRSIGPPLKRVMNDLGRAILAEMTTCPGLTAAIDQHVAAVREAVGRDGRVERENLVDYLHGIMDSIHEGVWADTQFRLAHSWPSLRIAAVCWIAREHGYVA